MISVVITAWHRKEYLSQAVRSCHQQKEADVEVVVVKDWEGPVPVGPDPERLVVLTKSLPVMGEMLAEGIARARGDVVKFLDDDDFLRSDRALCKTEQWFRDPALMLVRASRATVNSEGAVMELDYSIDRTIRVASRTGPRAGWLMKHRAFMNLSTIAIRRSQALRYLDVIRRIPAAPDLSMALLSWSGLGIGDYHLLVPDHDIAVRVHPSASRTAAGAANPAYFPRDLAALDMIREAVPLDGAAAEFLELNWLAISLRGFELGSVPRPSWRDWIRFGWSAVPRREAWVARDCLRLLPRMLRSSR